jgi:hypothetical protein
VPIPQRRVAEISSSALPPLAYSAYARAGDGIAFAYHS